MKISVILLEINAKNSHDSPNSITHNLSKVIYMSSGKYITRIDAKNIMHIDCMRIKAQILDDEPTIAVCGCQSYHFNDTMKPLVEESFTGLLNNPLVYFLGDRSLYSNTKLYQQIFLKQHGLNFTEISEYADFCFMIVIAEKGGSFNIESLPLYNQRVIET